MCRNIKMLFNFEPPASDEEIQAAAVQFVRKVSGSTKPSKANQEAFDRAVAEITEITRRLVRADLITIAEPRSREEEAERARERGRKRDQQTRARLLSEP